MLKQVFTILFLILSFVFVSCGGGSSGGSTTPSTSSVSGKVVDAPVRNATVTAYSDFEFQHQIGSGTTDNDGNFHFTINLASAPDPMYIKTEDGFNIDDNTSASAMTFVGSVYSDGNYYITPLTNDVYQRMLAGADYSTAVSDSVNNFHTGLSTFQEVDLFGNPLTNPDTNVTVSKVIQAGTSGISLSAGNYKLLFARFDERDLNATITKVSDIITNHTLDMNVTVSNTGSISGTVSGGGTLTGHISGTAMILRINLPTEIIKVAGSVGMFGSVCGTLTTVVSGNIKKGMFAGTFLPTSVNPAVMARKLISFSRGEKNFLYKSYIGYYTSVGFGDLNITSISSDLNITANNLNVTEEENTTTSTSITLDHNNSDSKVLKINSYTTSMATLNFSKPFSSGKVFIIQPVGLRKAIFVETNSTNQINAIGDAIINKKNVYAPNFDANARYQVTTFVAGRFNLTNPRSEVLNSMSSEFNTSVIPNLSATFEMNTTSDKVIYGGGNMIYYKDDDGDDLNDTNQDHIRSLELFESGAFFGEAIEGGFSLFGELRRYAPGVFVGRAVKDGFSPQPFNGTLNFISRILYTTTSTKFFSDHNGTLTINGNSASIVLSDGTTLSLSADFNTTSGIYHIYGQPANTYYMDIIWPVGSPKAIYSMTYDSNTSIESIGEAYLNL